MLCGGLYVQARFSHVLQQIYKLSMAQALTKHAQRKCLSTVMVETKIVASGAPEHRHCVTPPGGIITRQAKWKPGAFSSRYWPTSLAVDCARMLPSVAAFKHRSSIRGSQLCLPCMCGRTECYRGQLPCYGVADAGNVDCPI